MPDSPLRSSKHVLDPIDRVSEVLFGLIMVLGFTGSLSVAEAGRAEVRTMLLGALGCNFAWGIIDGVFYLMGCLGERGRGLLAFRELRQAATPEQARRLIADALPPLVAATLEPAELETMRLRLEQLPDPPYSAGLRRDDLLGALGVFLLVVLGTIPVAIPFMFMNNVTLALRVSDAIAMVLLYLAGYTFGRNTGLRPVMAGIAMIVLGAILVAITMALGG